MEPNSTEIVTCKEDIVQVIDYNRDVVLRSRKVNGETWCLSVSESQIFIGLEEPADIVYIYDKDLNRVKSIRLKGIREYDHPRDIAAAADRLYVCTVEDCRAIVYSQNSGSILTEYTTGQYYSNAWSITVSVKLEVVAVLWNKRQVAVYSLTTNNCLVVFNVESSVYRIRISDQGRIVTGNFDPGEVKTYDLAQFFTCNNLKITLSNLLSKHYVEELAKKFKIGDGRLEDDDDGRENDKKKVTRLLTVLEEKGFFQEGNLCNLKETFSHLASYHSSMVMNHIDVYQQHVERNTTNDSETGEGSGSGHKLQLDGFSADWSACDMSLSASYLVVAGYCKRTKKSSLDFICKDGSGSWSPWVKTREYGGESQSERFVSFIDEERVVTWCGNMVEIISCGTNEPGIKIAHQSSGFVTCVSVRNGEIYFALRESSQVEVLNINLQSQRSINLNVAPNMWPRELAVTCVGVIVCLEDSASSKVVLFRKENGEKLMQYKNVVDRSRQPQSVCVSEVSDLVVILWQADPVGYIFHRKTHMSLHSLTDGYCLCVVAVTSITSQLKRICASSEYLAVMDRRGGVQLVGMNQIFTEENVSSTLSRILSCKDCRGFQSPLGGDGEVNGSGSSREGCDDSEDGTIPYLEKMRRLDEILTIMTEKGHMSYECVNRLRDKFSYSEGSPGGDNVRKITERFASFTGNCKLVANFSDDIYHLHQYSSFHEDNQKKLRTSKLVKERKVLNFGRLNDEGDQMNVSFSSSDLFAVSCSSSHDGSFIFVYHWNSNSKAPAVLSFYRKFQFQFQFRRHTPFVGFLDGCKAVTCYNNLIEIVTFTSHVEVTSSYALYCSATCMAVSDGNIYLGFESSGIMVLNSNLQGVKTFSLQGDNLGLPKDLTVVAGRLFVCTDGWPSRALSFSEDGRKMMEYKYIPNQHVNRDRYGACSISVCETNDLVGIAWDPDNDVTLHSLSTGSCVAVLDDQCVSVLRFCGANTMRTLSSKGIFQCFYGDQQFMFRNWWTLFSYVVTYNEYEKLRKFYGISDQQIAEKEDGHTGVYVKTNRMKCLMEILEERAVIKPRDILGVKVAMEALCEVYIEKLWQPVQAYIKYSVKSSNHVAQSLLELTMPPQNLSQLHPDQRSSQGSDIPPVPGPSSAQPFNPGKRVVSEPHHFDGGGQLGGKRIRTSDFEPPQTPLTSSLLQLIQDETSLQPESVPAPVTGSLVLLQPSLSMSTSSSLIQTAPSPNLHGVSPVVSTLPGGNQRETQSKLLQSSQPINQPLCLQQPVGSEVIQQPSSLTELYSLNQVVQNGQHQVGQQVMCPGGPGNGQQVPIAGLPQAPPTRGQVVQKWMPHLSPQFRQSMPAEFRHSVPAQTRYPTPTGLRHCMPSQFRHSIPLNVRQPQGSQSIAPQFRQSYPPPVRQSSLPPAQGGRQFIGSQMACHVTQNEQRDTPQRHFIDGGTSQQVGHITWVQNLASAGNREGQHTLLQTTRVEGIIGQDRTENEVYTALNSRPDTQNNIPGATQLPQLNNLPQDRSGTVSGTELQDPRTSELQVGQSETLSNKDCASVLPTSYIGSQDIVDAVESCVKRVVTPLLNEMNHRLEHLLGSSNGQNPQHNIPGTSSQSCNVSNPAVLNPPEIERDEEGRRAWETLTEYNRMSLQAFRDMTDDRVELVRRLVEMVFTEEERHNQNCFGKSGKQKLDENKLRKIRNITFYLCPIVTKKTDNDKLSLEDVEWKRLCEVIDKSNRHYREKIKRQESRR